MELAGSGAVEGSRIVASVVAPPPASGATYPHPPRADVAFEVVGFPLYELEDLYQWLGPLARALKRRSAEGFAFGVVYRAGEHDKAAPGFRFVYGEGTHVEQTPFAYKTTAEAVAGARDWLEYHVATEDNVEGFVDDRLADGYPARSVYLTRLMFLALYKARPYRKEALRRGVRIRPTKAN